MQVGLRECPEGARGSQGALPGVSAVWPVPGAEWWAHPEACPEWMAESPARAYSVRAPWVPEQGPGQVPARGLEPAPRGLSPLAYSMPPARVHRCRRNRPTTTCRQSPTVPVRASWDYLRRNSRARSEVGKRTLKCSIDPLPGRTGIMPPQFSSVEEFASNAREWGNLRASCRLAGLYLRCRVAAAVSSSGTFSATGVTHSTPPNTAPSPQT